MLYNEYSNVLAFVLYSTGGHFYPFFKEKEFS